MNDENDTSSKKTDENKNNNTPTNPKDCKKSWQPTVIIGLILGCIYGLTFMSNTTNQKSDIYFIVDNNQTQRDCLIIKKLDKNCSIIKCMEVK